MGLGFNLDRRSDPSTPVLVAPRLRDSRHRGFLNAPGGRVLKRLAKRLFRQRPVTVMVVPDSGNDIRTLRVRPIWLQCTLGVAGVTMALALLVLFGDVPGLSTDRNAGELTEENALLRARLAGLEADLHQLEGRVHEAGLLEERMRLLADLEPIDDEIRLMGVGGPDFSARDPLHQVAGELATDVHRIRAGTDALLRQSELQRHSFLEVLESLEQREEHWAHIPSIRPLQEGRISSGFGRRVDPFTKRRAFHRGLDISARRGVPVLATADGKVIFAKKNGNHGLTVKIDHGNGIETLYAHLLDLKVKKGERVKRGRVVARVGSSGKSTAPHLHYEVRVDKRAVNPRRYILDRGVVID